MNIGYACIIESNENIKLKSYTLKSMTNAKIEATIEHNLNTLEAMFNYNLKHNIKLFRISSDIIPLASHEQFNYKWQEIFKDKLLALGQLAQSNQLRLSMHPGQYTIINSNKEEVINKAIRDLKYHCDFLDALGLDCSHKIVLHIGGVYNNKKLAIQRFINSYHTLDDKIKKRLVIENDDKFYNIDEVYEISQIINCPVIFDNLHHQLNKKTNTLNESDWIVKCAMTWLPQDGRQKIHYSQQDNTKRKGAHSKTIDTKIFLEFVSSLNCKDIDIMLEVKDKNISTIKCLNLIDDNLKLSELEKEWARYKYLVLEKSQKSYLQLRSLLKQRDISSKYQFYELVDLTLLSSNNQEGSNAYEHVWGYFKNKATLKEKEKFFTLLEAQKHDFSNIIKIKRHLYRLALKYDEGYLLGSYFFLYN